MNDRACSESSGALERQAYSQIHKWNDQKDVVKFEL